MARNFDRVFKALAEPSRRRIIELLCQSPRTAGDLGRRVGLAPNAVSFHLKELKATGLVLSKRDGRCIIYSIDNDAIGRWQSHVNDAFTPGAMADPPAASVAEAPAFDPPPQQSYAAPPVEDDAQDSLPTELL